MGLVIAKTLAPVVPMRIFGAREALPRSGGRLRFVPITVVIGEPIFFTAADIQPGGKDLYARLICQNGGSKNLDRPAFPKRLPC